MQGWLRHLAERRQAGRKGSLLLGWKPEVSSGGSPLPAPVTDPSRNLGGAHGDRSSGGDLDGEAGWPPVGPSQCRRQALTLLLSFVTVRVAVWIPPLSLAPVFESYKTTTVFLIVRAGVSGLCKGSTWHLPWVTGCGQVTVPTLSLLPCFPAP